MKHPTEGRRAPRREARMIARISCKITRLNCELETLHFMQDRLERKLESDRRSALRGKNNRTEMGGKGQ